MYDYMIEEMADAIARELRVDNHNTLRVLHQYWEDKIAHVWQVDDVLECAMNAGKPITRADALELLQNIFEDLDSELGITWGTLEIELQEYHLDLKRLPEDQYNEVTGVFKVWRQGNSVARQVGLFPDRIQGNLPKAIALAKSLADEKPDTPILIGCEPRHSDRVKPWLEVIRVEEGTQIEEKEKPCTRYSQSNASAS
ncbi:MAG: hypothetical protein QY302_08675 [Anaerolineales bacterium]|nr:MAG: hypothetical protein QY302_08675 [Anaerolineales bacterium]